MTIGGNVSDVSFEYDAGARLCSCDFRLRPFNYLAQRAVSTMSENDAQNLDGGLDLSSEPEKPPASRHGEKAASYHRSGGRARVYFNCCRVYSVVQIPAGVMNGKLSSWRFHCPRCGHLTEIPL